MTTSRTLKVLTGTNIVLGLWLALLPFVYGLTSTALWHALVMGLAIAVLATFDFELVREHAPASRGAAWTNTLLGLWVAASPLVMAAEISLSVGATANHVLVGLVVAAASAYVAVMGSSKRLVDTS